MRMNHPAILTLCLAMGATLASGPVLAANDKANSASKGYPNGRPWQAMKADFIEVKQMLDELALTLDGFTGDIDLIQDDLGLLHDDVAALAKDVSALGNTLDVQVSVMADAARNADNDAPVTLFVHVTHNGQAVTGLTAANFSYTNAFPVAGADFCGAGCFSAGDAGVYALTLNGDWSATSYAGALAVTQTVSTPDGDVTSNGSTMVNFDIPAAPAAP